MTKRVEVFLEAGVRLALGLGVAAVAAATGLAACARCGSGDASATRIARADAQRADRRRDGGDGASFAAASRWPLPVDPAAFGHRDLSRAIVAAFSQSAVSGRDPQVVALHPDIVPRAWGQWDTSGLRASDYDAAYPRECEARGVMFVGGLTASVIFADEMSSADFADEVGRDAANEPVRHDEVVPSAYRAALASPGFRRRIVGIAEAQIDAGVDGLFFDEVNSSYVGARYGGDEGFDDHDVADFGRFLCAKHGADASALVALGVTAADGLDCRGADRGASFDYRVYLARHGATEAPGGSRNPLRAEWGTTVPNRPDPSAGTFVEAVPTLGYWQEVVVAVREYARKKYGKEVLVTANGLFPFVDFQSVGLYDYNKDAPAPRGFDYVPVTGAAPDVHYDGARSFLPVLASLKARSDRLQALVGGPSVPLVLFIDWPTDTIERYYALPLRERKDYVRVMLAETYALGERFALPLATTTDAKTASALGMMDFFASMRDFYSTHAALLVGARDSPTEVSVTPSAIASHATTLADGALAVHLVNHNYAAGFVPQQGVTVRVRVARAPTSATVASPDAPADRPAVVRYAEGWATVEVGPLIASAIVVVR